MPKHSTIPANHPSDPLTLVDLPGIGPTDERHVPAVLRGRDGAPGETAATLKKFLEAEEYSAHFIRLLFAARRLAIECRVEPDARGGLKCMFCHATTPLFRWGAQGVGHADFCPVGNVMDVIDDLTSLAFPGTDGIRRDERHPRTAEMAVLLRQAALRQIVELPGYLTWRCTVCRSSVTGLDKSERDILHGCDCWVGNALIVLEDAHLTGGAR